MFPQQKLHPNFAKNLVELEHSTDTITVKSRLDTYNVRIYSSSRSLYLRTGWEYIVKQHRLQAGDAISLTFKSDVSLLLTIFEKSGAEKQYVTKFLMQGNFFS